MASISLYGSQPRGKGYYCYYDKRQNKLLFKSGWGATGLYVILEYTKTTD